MTACFSQAADNLECQVLTLNTDVIGTKVIALDADGDFMGVYECLLVCC